MLIIIKIWAFWKEQSIPLREAKEERNVSLSIRDITRKNGAPGVAMTQLHSLMLGKTISLRKQRMEV